MPVFIDDRRLRAAGFVLYKHDKANNRTWTLGVRGKQFFTSFQAHAAIDRILEAHFERDTEPGGEWVFEQEKFTTARALDHLERIDAELSRYERD